MYVDFLIKVLFLNFVVFKDEIPINIGNEVMMNSTIRNSHLRKTTICTKTALTKMAPNIGAICFYLSVFDNVSSSQNGLHDWIKNRHGNRI